MGQSTVPRGEAIGLAACSGAWVRLRRSASDRIRWVLVLAGAVVVLWLGSALLATPVFASAAMPIAAVQAGVLKAGDGSAADGKEKDGSESSESGSERSEISDEERDDEEPGREDRSESGRSEERDDEDSSREDRPESGRSEKHDADERDAEERQERTSTRPQHDRSGEDPENENEDGDRAESAQPDKGSGDEDPEESRRNPRAEESRRDSDDSSRNLKKLRDAVEALPEDEQEKTRDFLAKEAKRQKVENRAEPDDRERTEESSESHDRERNEADSPEEFRRNLRNLHDAVEALPEDEQEKTRDFLAKEAKRQKAESGRQAESRPSRAQESPEEFRRNLKKLHDAVEALPEAEQDGARGYLRQEAARQQAEKQHESVKAAEREESPEEFRRNLRNLHDAVEALPEAEGVRARAYLRREAARQQGTTPPSAELDTDDAEQALLTDHVLEGRLEIARGESVLAEQKKAVDAGRQDVEVFRQHLISHAALLERVDTESKYLSPDRVALINEVVAHHRNLDRSDEQLMLEEQLVARGEFDPATHARHKAEVDARRVAIMGLTDRLRELAGYAAADILAEDHAASGCQRTGAFVECQARSGAGETDRCVALAGAANACVVSAGSESDKAEAACIIDGGNHGCVSNVTRQVDGQTVAADTWCSSLDGVCDQTSGIGADGAAMRCEAGTECRGSATQRLDSHAAAANPARGPPGSTQANANCTGRCGISGQAYRESAAVDCHTTVGSCTVQTSGHLSPIPSPAEHRVDERRDGSGQAHCLTAGSCTAATAIGLRDGADAGASTECADLPGGCGGEATSSATAARSEIQGVSSSRHDEANGLATCTVGRGGCDTDAHAVVTGTHTATGTATVAVVCGRDCDGNGGSTAGVTATDTTPTASRTWASHGTGECGTSNGECGGESATQVRYAAPLGSGPGAARPEVVATSTAAAYAGCTDTSSTCSGRAGSRTDASDSAFNDGRPTGSGVTATCTVSGGTCEAGTLSLASSRGDHSGQPGPSSVSTGTASAVCAAGTRCSGTAATDSYAFDGAQPGVVRTSSWSATCDASTAGCQARSASAARAGAAGATATSDPRLIAPAVSAAGAASFCDRRTCPSTLISTDTRSDRIGFLGSGNPRIGASAVIETPDDLGNRCPSTCELVETRAVQAAVGPPAGDDGAPADEPPGDGLRPPVLPPTAGSAGTAASAGGQAGPGGSSGSNNTATVDYPGGSVHAGAVHTSPAGTDGLDQLAGGPGARGPPRGPPTTRTTHRFDVPTPSHSGTDSRAGKRVPARVAHSVHASRDLRPYESLPADLTAPERAGRLEAGRAAATGPSLRVAVTPYWRRGLVAPDGLRVPHAAQGDPLPTLRQARIPTPAHSGTDSRVGKRVPARVAGTAPGHPIQAIHPATLRSRDAWAPPPPPSLDLRGDIHLAVAIVWPYRGAASTDAPARVAAPYWHRGLVDPDALRARDGALGRTLREPTGAPRSGSRQFPGLGHSGVRAVPAPTGLSASPCAPTAVSGSAPEPPAPTQPHDSTALSPGLETGRRRGVVPTRPSRVGGRPRWPSSARIETWRSSIARFEARSSGSSNPQPPTAFSVTTTTHPEVSLGHAIATPEARAARVPRGPAQARAPPSGSPPRQFASCRKTISTPEWGAGQFGMPALIAFRPGPGGGVPRCRSWLPADARAGARRSGFHLV